MIDISELARRARAVGAPPCERFLCRERENCARELLACGAFLWYVNDTEGRVHHPDHVRGGKLCKDAIPVAPTREMYLRVMASGDQEKEDTKKKRLANEALKRKKSETVAPSVPTVPTVAVATTATNGEENQA
jgi:hypothetical protein